MPAKSGVSYGSHFPARLRGTRAPSGGAKGKKSPAAYGAPVSRPLVGPNPPIPGDWKKAQEERWHKWQASVVGNGTASILEFICWEWLTKVKGLRPEIDFEYQVPMFGGRTIAGGTVVDFYFPARNLAWNPAGLQFHYTAPSDRARDALVKALMGGRGINLIYLYEDDLMERPEYTMSHAWLGQQLPRSGA